MSLFLSVVIKSYLQMAMRLSVILSPYFAFGGRIQITRHLLLLVGAFMLHKIMFVPSIQL